MCRSHAGGGGNVTPSVRYLQRIATTLDVPRIRLEAMAGYPLDEEIGDYPIPRRRRSCRPFNYVSLTCWSSGCRAPSGKHTPRACEALAAELSASFESALRKAEGSHGRSIGFHLNDQ